VLRTHYLTDAQQKCKSVRCPLSTDQARLRPPSASDEYVMTSETGPAYLEPTQASGRDFMMRGIEGEVVMLNLLRFRDVADYSATPDLAPDAPLSGAAAYRLYIEHTLPHLRESGGDIEFMGEGGTFLIGPSDERWDMVLLVRHKDVPTFLSFAANEEYLSGMGHRLAAISDSRLLPIYGGQ